MRFSAEESLMLFALIYTPKGDTTEETEKRSLQLFNNWTPPAGYDQKAHYVRADGSGGIVIVEVSSAADLAEAATPWGPFFDITTVPVLDVEEGVSITQKVYDWRGSVR